MFEKEATQYALEWGDKTDGTYACCRDGFIAGAEFGYEQGIGRLRYCCTCKKWKECKVESMYGICADWEIKESE